MEFMHCNASSCQIITIENPLSLQYPFTTEYVHLHWMIKHRYSNMLSQILELSASTKRDQTMEVSIIWSYHWQIHAQRRMLGTEYVDCVQCIHHCHSRHREDSVLQGNAASVG